MAEWTLDQGQELLANEERQLIRFHLTSRQITEFRVTRGERNITQLVAAVNRVIDEDEMQRLTVRQVTDWLVKHGYLEEVEAPFGRRPRLATERGERQGITTFEETVNGMTNKGVKYDSRAQRFIVDHINEIAAGE